jgi:hypothetical protein
MQHLNPTALATVIGGTTSNDQITQQLTALQTSLASLGNNNNNNNSSSSSTMMMMAMCMAMRNQSTVIAGPAAAPAPAPVAGPPVAAGPVVNINTRVRH